MVLIPLVLLELIQVPIAVSLARRVKRHESERADLLERSLTGSEKERIRIAADIHDGPSRIWRAWVTPSAPSGCPHPPTSSPS